MRSKKYIIFFFISITILMFGYSSNNLSKEEIALLNYNNKIVKNEIDLLKCSIIKCYTDNPNSYYNQFDSAFVNQLDSFYTLFNSKIISITHVNVDVNKLYKKYLNDVYSISYGNFDCSSYNRISIDPIYIISNTNEQLEELNILLKIRNMLYIVSNQSCFDSRFMRLYQISGY